MKDYAWKIKIADLLNNPGNTDKVEFNRKFLKEIEIEEPWLKGKIFLQWINQDEIILKIKELEFKLKYKCDICGQEYEKGYKLQPNEEIKFVNEEKYPINEKIYDTTFPIDMKNKVIDLTPLIEIIVKNEEPVVKNCWKHSSQEDTDIQKNQDIFNENNIRFWDLLKIKKNVKN